MLTTGCTSQPKTKHFSPKVSESIPIIPTVRWIGDITAIALEWDPNHDPKIAGYSVYRRLKLDKNTSFERIAKINDRFTSHYIDLHLPHETKYLYMVSAFNHKGFESKPSPSVSTITRPTLKSVVYFDSLDKLPRKAKLIWRPHTNGRVSGYIIERKTPQEQKWHTLTTLEHRLSAEFIDNKLEDNKVYLYRLRALTFDKIKSTPSDIVRIVTKALPKAIRDVNITNKLPHSIKISWAKHVQTDIKEYHVYRSLKANEGYVLKAKVLLPRFEDKIKGHGRYYFYKISAVDFDALESDTTNIYKGKNLCRPKKVLIKASTLKDANFTLTWESIDDRAVSYKVVTEVSEGWFSTKRTSIDTNNSTFTNIQKPNVATKYEVIVVDKFGILSAPMQTKEFIYEKVVQ